MQPSNISQSSSQKNISVSILKPIQHRLILSKAIHEYETSQIIQQLKSNQGLQIDFLRRLIYQTSLIFQKKSNIIDISSPVIIVGDIHGQFYDLLNIFDKCGTVDKQKYLFLGDYVDRGQFCIEVITLLMFLKIKYPKNIYLLRGNHQSRVLASSFNFKNQCLHKYNQEIYFQFMDLFDRMSLGAIVDGRYFCVHAGISPQFPQIRLIQSKNRFKQPPTHGGICDLLWSDPVQQFIQKWKPNNNRMCSYFYGLNHSRWFLQKNKLKMIIRGHQVQNAGHKYQKLPDGKTLSITIFSAPNYCDMYKNKGAVLLIQKDKLNVFTFSESVHPIILSNYMNILQWSIPFLAQQVTKLFKTLLLFQNQNIHKKTKSQSILTSSPTQFSEQMSALQKIQIFQQIIQIDKKKHQNQIKILKQNLNKVIVYSLEKFKQIKQKDKGEMLPGGQLGNQIHGEISTGGFFSIIMEIAKGSRSGKQKCGQGQGEKLLCQCQCQCQQNIGDKCVKQELLSQSKKTNIIFIELNSFSIESKDYIIIQNQSQLTGTCSIGPNLHQTFNKITTYNTFRSFKHNTDDIDQFEDIDI